MEMEALHLMVYKRQEKDRQEPRTSCSPQEPTPVTFFLLKLPEPSKWHHLGTQQSAYDPQGDISSSSHEKWRDTDRTAFSLVGLLVVLMHYNVSRNNVQVLLLVLIDFFAIFILYKVLLLFHEQVTRTEQAPMPKGTFLGNLLECAEPGCKCQTLQSEIY